MLTAPEFDTAPFLEGVVHSSAVQPDLPNNVSLNQFDKLCRQPMQTKDSKLQSYSGHKLF